ncbi:MAG: AAA family ATPase [Acidobacteria bacterium]|nr:AAA family ATPase [Acidobacteriota bacterium]
MLMLTRTTDSYPTGNELVRLTAVSRPDVLLIDLENPDEAMSCIKSLQEIFPEAPLICFGGTAANHKSFRLFGVHHYLPYPCEPHDFIAALAEAIRAQHAEPMPELFAFIPAKAGSGCTTLTAGVAATMANSLGKRVLCVEADLRSGPMAMMFEASTRGSIQGALSAAYELDNFKWQNSVTSICGVDFLLSAGGVPKQIPEWSHYFALLRFVRERYDVILFDLPELINDSTEEVIRRAALTIVVTTQEPVALKMAERRIHQLRTTWGAEESRIRLLVNRWTSRDTSVDEVAAIVATPPHFKIPNDYQRARQVQAGGLPVPPVGPLGKALLEFSEQLLGISAPGGTHAADRKPAGLSGMFRSFVSRPAR